MKNDSDKTGKKDKKISRIKDQLAKLRAKLKASKNQQSSLPSKHKPKKIKSEIKPKEAKKKEIKVKAKEAKKKAAKIKAIEKKKPKEAKKEDEITGFQLEKTDMDKMCNRVCEIIADYETNGVFQSELWKKLKLSSRDGSRLALKLERMGMITREKILEKERWTYKLIIKKIPISTKSLEGAPCLTCPVESKCSLDSEVSPKTCQWIEDWVILELKNK